MVFEPWTLISKRNNCTTGTSQPKTLDELQSQVNLLLGRLPVVLRQIDDLTALPEEHRSLLEEQKTLLKLMLKNKE